jgi:hypothetical protein
MSIDSRFSKDRFQMEAQSDPGARHLSDQLQEEVLAILQEGVFGKVHEIVGLLNEHGHNLRLYYPAELGDISFRDDRHIGGTYECDLRLGVDIVTSVGFRDTVVNPDEPVERGGSAEGAEAEGNSGAKGRRGRRPGDGRL